MMLEEKAGATPLAHSDAGLNAAKARESRLAKIILIAAALVAAIGAATVVRTAAGPDDNSAKEAVYLRNIKQLTFDGTRSGEGYFSPDGNQIIFQSTRGPTGNEAENPFYQIYTMDLRTGKVRRISSGIGKTTCSFFRPDGKRVIYASTHLDPDAVKKQREEIETQKAGKQRRYQWDFDPFYDIFDANPDGSDLRRLTTAKGYDAEGSYSPDGKHICFTSNRDGDLEIYVMDADGGNQRRLTHDPGYDGGPFFSPDGQWIVYRHFTDDQHSEVMLIRPDGSDKHQVTHLGAMNWAPYFHPGGKWIVFASNKDGIHPGNFQLYIIHPDGGGLARITYSDGFEGLPVFSPDGRKLMWTSTRAGGKSQLFIADFVPPPEPGAAASAAMAAANGEGDFNPAGIKEEIAYLASPALEGRRTATPGERKAADYIEQQLHSEGFAKVNEQRFDFQSGFAKGPDNSLVARIGADQITGAIDKDYAPLSLSANGQADGEVVFVGYGIVAANYDSYAGLEVKNKIVLAMRYSPESAPEKEKERLRHFAPLRLKAMLAREHGAKAILVFAGPNSLPQDSFIKDGHGVSFADSGIVAAQISRALAEKMLSAAGKNLKQTQDSMDKLEAQAGFAMGPVSASLRVDLKKETATGRNVWTVVHAGAPDRTGQAIVIGAHYDHLGRGDENSLAEKLGDIHPGADDNASGTAGVLELARYFEAHRDRLRRDLVFVLFSGEELGVLGSAAFCKHPPIDLKKVVAMINMDMIGRLREQHLVIQGAGSAALWPRLVEEYAAPAPLRVTLSEDPYLPTDSISFYEKEIPTLNFFTGSHADYHRPSDTADKIDASGEAEVLALERNIIEDLATRPDAPHWSRVAGHSEEGPGREGLRAYLGTIPDYADSSQPGVKLSGVRPGSPAEKAGLKAGDVIVKFGGRKIANIYDYTYALEDAKIGTPTEMVVNRQGKAETVTIVPGQRK